MCIYKWSHYSIIVAKGYTQVARYNGTAEASACTQLAVYNEDREISVTSYGLN